MIQKAVVVKSNKKIMALFSKIDRLISTIDIESITENRKRTLQPLIDFINLKNNKQQEIRINFICTHNSRRSHLAQIWGQAMAYHFDIKNTFCYSGGTESTALFPMVAQTLQNTGFEVTRISENENPVYSIKYTDNEHPVIGFSKKIDDKFNPTSEFAAVMTCSQADGGCPFILGAEKRIPITFEDPKISDNTPEQTQVYAERSLQIATEMFYVFSHIKK